MAQGVRTIAVSRSSLLIVKRLCHNLIISHKAMPAEPLYDMESVLRTVFHAMQGTVAHKHHALLIHILILYIFPYTDEFNRAAGTHVADKLGALIRRHLARQTFNQQRLKKIILVQISPRVALATIVVDRPAVSLGDASKRIIPPNLACISALNAHVVLRLADVLLLQIQPFGIEIAMKIQLRLPDVGGHRAAHSASALRRQRVMLHGHRIGSVVDKTDGRPDAFRHPDTQPASCRGMNVTRAAQRRQEMPLHADSADLVYRRAAGVKHRDGVHAPKVAQKPRRSQKHKMLFSTAVLAHVKNHSVDRHLNCIFLHCIHFNGNYTRILPQT